MKETGANLEGVLRGAHHPRSGSAGTSPRGTLRGLRTAGLLVHCHKAAWGKQNERGVICDLCGEK